MVFKSIFAVGLYFSLLCVGVAQNSAWQQVSPTPQGNPLSAISVVDQNTVFACGANATFLASTNGGDAWFVDNNLNGLIEQFYAIQFVNSQTGWIGGEAGTMLKTTNGGMTWTAQTVPTVSDIYSLHFVSTSIGWASGGFGTIFKTTDGGATWVAQNSTVASALFSIQFVNTTTGWAVGGNGVIVKTTNGGTSWQQQFTGVTNTLYSVNFASTTTGWAVGNDGMILKTTDAGAAWGVQPNEASLTLYGAHFVSANTGWAIGAYGTVMITTNGGAVWGFQYADTYKDFLAVRFASSSIGWAVGDYGVIFKTTNGGTTWVNKSGVSKTELTATFFSSASTGYQVGEEAVVVKTTDGGISWADKKSNISLTQWLWGVSFLNDNTGYVVGDSGYVAKTVTGGNAWVQQQSGLEFDEIPLYSIYFIDAQKGWISGDYGSILRTTTGGAIWIPETTEVFSALLKIKFINANVGWAVGDFGTILKSTNGGATWEVQESGTTATIYSLEIIDQNTVFASGDYGLILKTTNGGATWQEIPFDDVIDSFYDITSYGANNFWVASDELIIRGTSDGGNTWNQQNGGGFYRFINIQAVPASSGAVIIASGEGNAIFKSVLSPLPVRTWTGNSDSLWTNANNWAPVGVPEITDSVYIPSTSKRATLRHSAQKITIGALNVGTGGRMFIGSGISEFSVFKGIILNGTIDVESGSRTDIISSGGFIINSGTFNQGSSTLTLKGTGNIKGTFDNVIIAESSKISTGGNVAIANSISLNSIISGRDTDTLSVTTPNPAAISGIGLIEGGTVKRAIAPGSTEAYRFGSPVTNVQFYSGGTNPTSVLLTSFPNTLSPEMPDSVFVKRYYVGKTVGGSNFKAKVSLMFNEFETDLFPDEVAFFTENEGYFDNLGSSDYKDDIYMATSLDSVSNFTKWFLGDATYFQKHPLQFSAKIALVDNGASFDTLFLGSAKNATQGLDDDFLEIQLGPKPSLGTFDVRWKLPGNEETLFDYRPFTEGSNFQNIFTGEFQPGIGGYPFNLSWSFENQALGTIYIRDAATSGSKFNVNMKNQSSLVISDTSIKSFQVVQTAPTYVSVLKNWNIVSMPIIPTTSSQKSYLFPTSLSNAFGFNNGYFTAESLVKGRGYWLKFFKDQSVGLEGFPRTRDTINVVTGWNMIGSISFPVPTSTIIQSSPGLVTGSFFGYAGGYLAKDTIIPGKGYWVKTTGSGTLILASSGFAKEANDIPSPELSKFASLIIKDAGTGNQALYIGDETGLNVPLSWFELPPLPPSEVFDARFTSNRMVEPLSPGKENTYTVVIQSRQYPLTIQCERAGSDVQTIIVTDAHRGTQLGTISSDGKSSLRIDNPAITKLEFSVRSGVELPKVYSLEQNYPNPFNPSTTIQFNIPEPAILSMQIFNVLGQEVTTLLDRVAFDPGSHVQTWNASSFGSGIYFYRLIATKPESGEIVFQQMKKLVLVK